MNDVKTPFIIAFVLSYEFADTNCSFLDRHSDTLGYFLQIFSLSYKKVIFFTFFSLCHSVKSVPPIRNSWASLMAQWLKNPAVQKTEEMWV